MTSTMPKYALKKYFERVNWNSVTTYANWCLIKNASYIFCYKNNYFFWCSTSLLPIMYNNFFYRFLWKMGATKSLKYGCRMMLNLNRNILRCISCIHTLLLNEGIPRAYRGKKLRLKNILSLPLIFEGMNSF